MIKFTHQLTLLVSILAAGNAAAVVMVTDRAQQELTISPAGVVVIDNPHGNIEVVGGDEAKVVITADRAIQAADGTALNEARGVIHRVLQGNDSARFIRTVGPVGTHARWSAQVHFSIVMPRTASLKITSQSAGRIRVADIRGQVIVNNMVGPVLVENPGGEVAVDTVNGNITFVAPHQVAANARLTSINGTIIVRAAANAGFVWEAETMMGTAKSGFAIRGGQFLSPLRFRGAINSPGNATILTETFRGHLLLAPIDGDDTAAKSVHAMLPPRVVARRPGGGVGPSLPEVERRDVRLPLVQGYYEYGTSIGNVRIDEIRGAARIFTGAGEVHLGTVFGHCNVISEGGPITLGEIVGPLKASTAGGNVTVQRARAGGSITTGGGTILLQYAGGPAQLSSGGGDIVVRQANGPVNAETKSGDITIVVDAGLRSERLEAKTAKGNIAITVPVGFGADIDATVLTSDPTANSIRSDLPGLSVQREQVGGKTRIRATGKVNGGGERVELNATDGGVYIAVDGPRVSPQVPVR